MLQSQPASTNPMASLAGGSGGGLVHHSKRKAADAPENNERLSKRLSLLNIDQSGTRLYARPVQRLSEQTEETEETEETEQTGQIEPIGQTRQTGSRPVPDEPPRPDDSMLVDDTKHKVYIYNMDDELSSESDSDGAMSDADRLVFLPGMAKHLHKSVRDRAIRHSAAVAPIPRPVPVNADGELAGMQLVLYSDPSSLSVPREHDSVRKAILDARARLRERQRERERKEKEDPTAGVDMTDEPSGPTRSPSPALPLVEDDSDAMEMD